MTTLIVLGRGARWHCPESRQRQQLDSGRSSTVEHRFGLATLANDPLASPPSSGIAIATHKGTDHSPEQSALQLTMAAP